MKSLIISGSYCRGKHYYIDVSLSQTEMLKFRTVERR